MSDRLDRGFSATIDLQLFENVLQMHLDSVETDENCV